MLQQRIVAMVLSHDYENKHQLGRFVYKRTLLSPDIALISLVNNTKWLQGRGVARWSCSVAEHAEATQTL